MDKAKAPFIVFAFLLILASTLFTQPVFAQLTALDPLTIPKWVNQLEGPPPVYVPTNITDNSGNLIRQEYSVKASQFNQQILPITDENGNPTGFGTTKVWGYEGEAKNAVTGENLGSVQGTPAPTFEVSQGMPVQVKWINNLVDDAGNPLSYMFPVDPTIHWSNPKNVEMPMAPVTAPLNAPWFAEAQSPAPIVTHLHGGETSSASDGYPEAWWTPDGEHGPAYGTSVDTEANSAVYTYPNGQQPTTLWYHDHALGLTRINVFSGLAGFYLIRNATDPVADLLPKGEYEIPLAIQDRLFLSDGSLYYPVSGDNPTVHPYWIQRFLGDVILVNGKAWPNMNVKQGQYRFRILDASNSRLYRFRFSNGMSFTQIGTDGGYLKSPIKMTSLFLGPAERADILVDFSNIPVGQKIVLENSGAIGSEVQAQTTGQIMQFTVTDEEGFTPNQLPSNLNPTLTSDFPTLPSPAKERIFTLINVDGPNGLEAMLLDGQKWSSPISETPELGSTEDWIIVNPTMDAHPIHVHLVQFQIIHRQTYDVAPYLAEWTRLNGSPPFNQPTVNVADFDSYLTGKPTPPSPGEQGWKDTVIANSGEVVVIRLRWTEQNGNPFPFDATAGPGYVWHCHLLEHEDNEMMRPYVVVSASQNVMVELVAIAVIIVVIVVLFVFLAIRRSRRRRQITSKRHSGTVL